MRDERNVWIVGDPEEGAHATGHRYHVRQCYVLDQVHNRDRVKEVDLAGLPDGYGPCKICVPGGRVPGGAPASRRHELERQEPRRGVQLGHSVQIEDIDTGEVSCYRLVARLRGSGEISTQSPLGSALLGKEEGAVAEFKVRKGGLRKVRIVSFRAENH